jgi:hypothetical protein
VVKFGRFAAVLSTVVNQRPVEALTFAGLA